MVEPVERRDLWVREPVGEEIRIGLVESRVESRRLCTNWCGIAGTANIGSIVVDVRCLVAAGSAASGRLLRPDPELEIWIMADTESSAIVDVVAVESCRTSNVKGRRSKVSN